MKREDKTNKTRRRVENKSEEKLFTLDQAHSLAALVAAGVMGIGGQECIEEAEKLPEELQKVLATAVVAARECIMARVPSMLASVLAKAGK